MKSVLSMLAFGVAVLLATAGNVPAFAESGTASKSEQLAYCLGDVEKAEQYMYAVADAEANMKARDATQKQGLERLSKDMRKGAAQEAAEGARIRSELEKLGALVGGNFRSRELEFYRAGYLSAQACFVHQAKPCMQKCIQSHPDLRPENCEKTCGLPQACKKKFDCEDFDPTG